MKYEFTGEIKVEFGITLRRIRAAVAFRGIAKGDLGGFIEKEDNLSQAGDAWVSDDAQVSGDAQVSDDAQVSGNAWVSGNAQVFGNARVSGDARVFGNARVSGDAQVFGDAQYLFIGCIGSRADVTTFYRNKSAGISVRCGCFCGTLEAFRVAVKNTHGDTKYAEIYQAAADLAELQIETEKKAASADTESGK